MIGSRFNVWLGHGLFSSGHCKWKYTSHSGLKKVSNLVTQNINWAGQLENCKYFTCSHVGSDRLQRHSLTLHLATLCLCKNSTAWRQEWPSWKPLFVTHRIFIVVASLLSFAISYFCFYYSMLRSMQERAGRYEIYYRFSMDCDYTPRSILIECCFHRAQL